jgi:hypothetical protein
MEILNLININKIWCLAYHYIEGFNKIEVKKLYIMKKILQIKILKYLWWLTIKSKNILENSFKNKI